MSTELARKLRQQLSPPERAMWRILHQFRQEGWHFRRQLLIGTYYADFACRQPALVIEVDGQSHDSHLAQANDAARDDYFRSRGFRVLRFSNSDVVSKREGVYLAIEAALSTLSLPPRGEGSAARGDAA